MNNVKEKTYWTAFQKIHNGSNISNKLAKFLKMCQMKLINKPKRENKHNFVNKQMPQKDIQILQHLIILS